MSLGCGLGRFLRGYISNEARLVVGLDINHGNLEECKKTGACLVLGDVENLPFRDNVFEIVECEATMEHITRPVRVMKEVNRIIDPKIGISFLTYHVYRWWQILTNRKIRLRFVLYVRDLILDFTHFGRFIKISENSLLRVFFYCYGTYRNKGFSYPEIQRIYREAKIGIVLVKVYGHVVFVAGVNNAIRHNSL